MSRPVLLFPCLVVCGLLPPTVKAQNAAPAVTLHVTGPLDEKLAAAATEAFRSAMKAVPVDEDALPVGIGETALPRDAAETLRIVGKPAPWNDSDVRDDGRILDTDEQGIVIEIAGGAARTERHEIVTIPEILGQLHRLVEARPADAGARLARSFALGMSGDKGRSISDLSSLIEQNPGVTDYRVLRASDFVSLDRDDEAIVDISKAIELKPTCYAHAMRARCLAAKERYDEALRDIAEALRLDPTCTWAFIHRAAIEQQRHQYDAAIADCSEAIRLQPREPRWRQHRAELHYESRRFEPAVADLKDAIKMSKSPSADLYTLVGVCCSELNRADEALDALNESIRLDCSASTLFLRSEVRVKLKQPEAARADLLKAAELPCQSLVMVARIARQLDDFNEPKHAHDLYARIADMEAESSKELALRGEARLRLGKTTEAIADLTRALEADPKEVEGRRLRAIGYTMQQQWPAAIADFTTILQELPDDISCLESRANCYIVHKDYARALVDLSKAATLEPDNADFHARRGWMLLELGEWSESLAALKKALELDGRNHVASRELTWLLATCPDEAIQDGTAALKQATWYLGRLDEDQKSVHDSRALAAAYAAAGDFEEAVKNQKLVVESYRQYAKTPAQLEEAAEEVARLELYQSKRPFIEQPVVRTAAKGK